jgi:amidase
VAAAIVAVGHANDGGGSIRIPASECGLVGLKPSRGRVTQAPDLGESWAGATIDGAVTRTVRDAAAVLDAISGYEVGDPYTAVPFARPLSREVGEEPGRLRIGLLDRAPTVPAHADCVAAVATAGRLLADLGHDVEPSSPAAMFDPAMLERFLTVLFVSAAVEGAELEAILGRPLTDDDLEHANRAAIRRGGRVSGVDYLAAVNGQHAWTRQMLSWWHPGAHGPGFDLLVTPVIAGPPPPIGWLSGPQADERMRELLQFTAQFNVTGQPAVSLPLHWNDAGVPIGVQLVAAHGREDLLVRVASQLETAAPWADRVPPVSARA